MEMTPISNQQGTRTRAERARDRQARIAWIRAAALAEPDLSGTALARQLGLDVCLVKKVQAEMRRAGELAPAPWPGSVPLDVLAARAAEVRRKEIGHLRRDDRDEADRDVCPPGPVVLAGTRLKRVTDGYLREWRRIRAGKSRTKVAPKVASGADLTPFNPKRRRDGYPRRSRVNLDSLPRTLARYG